MGLSRIPVLTLIVACILGFYAITRLKKDRKSVVGIYILMGIGCLLITIERLYGDLINSFILNAGIAICFITGIGLIYYTGWTNKENPNAKKLILISLIGLAICGILLLMICLI